MNNLLNLNSKYKAYTIQDLQRIGSIGDEEAIMELGRRVLDDNLETVTCPKCDNEFKLYDGI